MSQIDDKILNLKYLNNYTLNVSSEEWKKYLSWTFENTGLKDKTFGYYSSIVDVATPYGNIVSFLNVAVSDIGHIYGTYEARVPSTGQIIYTSFDFNIGRVVIPIKLEYIDLYTNKENPRKQVLIEHVSLEQAMPVNLTSLNNQINLYNILEGDSSYSLYLTIFVSSNKNDYYPQTSMWAKNGKENAGYYTLLNGGGIQIIDIYGNFKKNISGYTDSNGNWIGPSTVNLYAKIIDKTITITFNLNKSWLLITNYNTYTNSQNVLISSIPLQIQNVPIYKDNSYKFIGYYSKKLNGSKIFDEYGNVIANVSEYTGLNGKWIYPENVTLYAQYEPYQVVVDLNTHHYIWINDNDNRKLCEKEIHVNPFENPWLAHAARLTVVYNTNLISSVWSNVSVGDGTDLEKYALNPVKNVKGMEFLGYYTNPGAKRYNNQVVLSGKYNDHYQAPIHAMSSGYITQEAPRLAIDKNGNILRNIAKLTDSNGNWICTPGSSYNNYGLIACFLDNRYKIEFVCGYIRELPESPPHSSLSPLDLADKFLCDSTPYFGDTSEYSSTLFWYKERVIYQELEKYADFYEGYLAFTSAPTKIDNTPFVIPDNKNLRVRSIILPSSIVEIGTNSFCWLTMLQEVTIPNPSVYIAPGAFEMCWALKTIYFGGTSSEWKLICLTHPGGGNPLYDVNFDLTVICLGDYVTLKYKLKGEKEFEWFI